MKKIALAGMLCMFTGFALAQTVSVELVWASPLEEKIVTPYVQAIVGGCLLQLFDKGYMGTNTVPVSGTKEVFESVSSDAETEEAYVDYIIVLFLEIMDIKTGPGKISYRVISVVSGKEIGKGSVPAPTVMADSSQDFIKYYHTLGTLIMKDIISSGVLK